MSESINKIKVKDITYDVEDSIARGSAIQDSSLQITTTPDSVSLSYTDLEGETFEVPIPAATAEKAGVMSVEDKRIFGEYIKSGNLSMHNGKILSRLIESGYIVAEEVLASSYDAGFYDSSGNFLAGMFPSYKSYHYPVTPGEILLCTIPSFTNFSKNIMLLGFWKDSSFSHSLITTDIVQCNIAEPVTIPVIVPASINSLIGYITSVKRISVDKYYEVLSKYAAINSTTLPSISNDLINKSADVTGVIDSPYYIASKIFYNGGKVTELNFSELDFASIEGKKVKIVTGIVDSQEKLTISSISEAVVVSSTTDVSDLNIMVPINGVVGIVNDENIKFKYNYKGLANLVYVLDKNLRINKTYNKSTNIKTLSFTHNISVLENIPLTNSFTELQTKVDSLKAELNAQIVSYNMPVVETSGTMKVDPTSWISSTVFRNGGKARKALFYKGSEELQGGTGYIVVGRVQGEKAIITNRVPFIIDSNEIDLSGLEIEIPANGIVGINFNISPANYGYKAVRPTDFTREVFVGLGATNVGIEITQHETFSYLNFPFNVEVDEYVSAFQLLDNRVTALESTQTDVFKNKKICIFGDSITWLALSGNPQRGWVTHFEKMIPFKEVANYARSGATWSNTANTVYNITENVGELSDNNVIYNQINRLLKDIEDGADIPDYIMILAGTNDQWYPSSRPDAVSKEAKEVFEDNTNYLTSKQPSECTSIAEAIRYVAEMLFTNLPNTQIVLCTPLQGTHGNITYNSKVATIIKDCGAYMSWNVIEQNKDCGISRLQEARAYHNTYDGVHTSEIGAKMVAGILASKCKSILKISKE